MGSFCKSGPQTTTTNQTQTYTPNSAVSGAGTEAINLAQGAASQPFQTPAAPVAGFNPFQQQAFSQYQGIQEGTNPFFQNASNNMTTAQAPVTQSDIAGFENPYSDQALAAMKKYVFDPQRTQAIGSDTQTAGGIGADRLALTSQNIDKTQADAVGQAQAGFYGQALSAAQQSKQQALQSAQGWANLGTGQQTAQLQATGALAGAGAQQQAQSQAELMSPYEQTLARIAYPYQQAQFLAGITGGLSGALGGTTTGQGTQNAYAATPSMLNQIMGGAGIGLAAYGMATGDTGSNGYSTSTPNSPGAAMYTGDPTQAGFGPTYAEGGAIDDPMDVIPDMSLQNTSGQGQAHNNLNLTPTKTASGSGGGSDVAGTAMKAAQMAMMFMKSGGSVNPWDMGQGFAPGGDVEEVDPADYNRIDDQLSRPIEGPTPDLGMWPFNRGAADKTGHVTMYPPPSPSGAQAAPMATPPTVPNQNPFNVPANAGRLPMPGAYTKPLPPAIPSPIPQPTAVAQATQPQDRTGGYGPRMGGHGINSDMKISDYEMPQSQQPYPDALQRDAGQTGVRSPWMALLHGAAKTAQSTKNGIAGLAEGVEAGANYLDKQRTELRSEQQINQKAQELYRHAKGELDKYTRKTPHELATEHHQEQVIAQNKFQAVNYTDPATNEIRLGNYNPKTGQLTDATTHQPVGSGARRLGSNAGLPMTDAQIERAAKDRFVNEPGKYPTIDAAREAVVAEVHRGQTVHGTQPGSSAQNAIPDPGDGNRVSGTWYINPQTGKPDRWR